MTLEVFGFLIGQGSRVPLTLKGVVRDLFFFAKKNAFFWQESKFEISQRSEGVGTPDLESLQGISFPNDFS